MNKEKIIFFGNGPLADYALAILEKNFEIIFHAREKADLETVKSLKKDNPEAHGILASFGVIIKEDVLDLFEPEGILNIHPSLLPKYRGPSPIESAILNGDNDFSVSIMKLVKAMDAGPIYYQTTLKNLPLEKDKIYQSLSETGATWLSENLGNLPTPVEQDGKNATFTQKLDKSQSNLVPETDTAEETFRKIVAFQGFPKPKYAFFGQNCIILEAHIPNQGETAVLPLECKNGQILAIDKLQPEGRKPMDAKSFLNGYKK
ncbi:hypothetical protein IJI94_01665 [Candidatus Saccharibacteria bacterium]|nr:hypothetical protein [Candidatus Saccharibacteria bacterium]